MKKFIAILFAITSAIYVTDACTGLTSVPSIPIPSGGPTGIGGKCLHVDSEVLMADGDTHKRAGDLVIGDRLWAENGQSTPVIMIPAAEVDNVQTFIQFKTENGFGTTLTSDHAVFARPCGTEGQESWPIKRSIDLMLGDCVPTIGGREDRVISVRAIDLKGRIQPITGSGKIATGGVFVSCYDYTNENVTQEEKHAPLEPARLLYTWAEKIYDTLSNELFALGIIDNLIRGMGLEKFYYQ